MMRKEESRRIDRPNLIGGVVVALVLIGLPFGTYLYQTSIRPEQMAQQNMIEILAYREEAGGWTLDKIELSKGETYTIKLLAIDVSHGFEVDGFNISVVLIPGHPQEVTITPMETGSFEFRCTIYCSELHSSMRGTIVVA